MNKIKEFIAFLNTDIWRIRVNTLKGARKFWIRHLQVFLLALRGYDEDKCQLRASALTFYTLLSIVPIVAMAFGISKGFGLEKTLEKILYEKLPGQENVVSQIINFANAFLENTKGGVIAGIGIVILFWTIIKVLGNIEDSFNDIWGIKKGRSFSRKFSDYLSIMLICPILLIMASSMTVLITSQVTLLVDKLSFLGPVADVILWALRILPYAVIWAVFTFIYIFLPNTKVRISSGIMGGIVAGTIYQFVQWLYITFQVGVSSYGAIYGSFAALPLFLVWLQVSWLIVLFGAELSFAEQNVETYEFEPDCLKVSHEFKRLIALSITHLCVKNLMKAKKPLTASEIAHELEMPIRLVNQVLFDLVEAQILVEAKIAGSDVVGYQLGRDVNELTIESVVRILDQRGVSNIPIIESDDIAKLAKTFKGFRDDLKNSSSAILLKNI